MIRAARRIVEKLKQHGHKAYFAGGWIRDSILNEKSKDIDIATSAKPFEVRSIFPNSLDIGAQFGVVQVRMYGRTYEVTTFRSDNAYYDGRHPVDVSFSTPKQDALRRDFTINGLFFDPETNRVIDYVNGEADIKNCRIRTIGNPYKRFHEDRLRMLRAIRFACRLKFKITAKTWKAITELAPLISDVSWERIRDELSEILTGPAPGAGLKMLHSSGLLSHILPEVEELHGRLFQPGYSDDLLTHTIKTLDMLYEPSIPLAFGALLHEIGTSPFDKDINADLLEERSKAVKKVCRRLRMSRKETERISSLVESQAFLAQAEKIRESDLKRFMRKQYFDEYLKLYRVHAVSLGIPIDTYHYWRRKHKEFVHELTQKPLVNGKDLISLGYQPGPIFQKILRSIEDLQLEGTLKTHKEALRYIRQYFPVTRG
jgi:poly(A) polymerase